MSLLGVVVLSPVVFVVACVWRLVDWLSARRVTSSDQWIIGPRHLVRIATAALWAAVFGLALVTVLASVLVASYHREQRAGGDFSGLLTAALAVGVYAVVVPIANWLAMRALGVQPARLAALGSWAFLGAALLLAHQQIPGGGVQPGWFYGLVAPVPYALAAVAVVCVPAPAEDRRESDDPATADQA
ncbi:hypothetical protein [Actinoplanes palleronii]|uniref:hypothetical protein n=1 Tax=Actinoplanes palleronii TaxID=113570 RepID=UPI0019428738|nr:hypothetical protein [Actinoplanes palleronii]